MQKSTFIVLICMVLLTPWTILGQTTASKGTFTLPTGQIRLRTLFETISNQTGIIFSYDANNINDYESVTIGKSNTYTLTTFLTLVLPEDIKFKKLGKYIVLNKKSNQNLVDAKPLSSRQSIDLSDLKPVASEIVYLFPKVDFSDSINVKRMGSTSDSSGTGATSATTLTFTPYRMQWSIETIYNPHLMHLSLMMGKKHFFGKATIGYDYHDSYHLGIGVGTNFNLTPVLGLSLEISQYTLAFGKTRKIDINTYTTEFTPLLTYGLNKKLRFKVGPSIFRIQSNLKTKHKIIDHGTNWGCNAAIGMQILLFESK